MKNPFEKSPERIPNGQDVMELIRTYAENATLVRELSDEQGLYLLEAKVEGDKPGEVIQYEYMRKGRHPNQHHEAKTSICIMHYQGDRAVGGSTIAVYDSATGEWRKIPTS